MNDSRLEASDLAKVQALPMQKQAAIRTAGTQSLYKFAEEQICPVVRMQLKRKLWEQAIWGTYLRMHSIVKGVVKLDEPCHFQLAAMGARSLFELLLDLKLLAKDRSWAEKFFNHVEVDKFKKTKILRDFLNKHPEIDSKPYLTAVQFANDSARKQRLEQLCLKHWGKTREGKTKWPTHWSGTDSIKKRAQDAGTEYELFYLYNYGQLSWDVHSGVAGILKLSRDALTMRFCVAHDDIWRLFDEATKIVAEVFHLFEAQPKLRKQLEQAAHTGAALTMARLLEQAETTR